MVHRIQNRNPGYSDFQNISTSQSTNFSNIFSSPVSDGATALKLENEIPQENEVDNQSDFISQDLSHEKLEQENKLENEENFAENTNNEEKVSNGLENFEIEEDVPELFNSDETNNSEEGFTSFDNEEGQKEEDDLEIPAFLRRQRN